jgi:hypothetical protein
VHNNYAVTIITEHLQTPKLPQAEKIALLKKAKDLLKKSAGFYNRANLPIKRNKIKREIHCIESSLKNLASFMSKVPTDPILSIGEKEYHAKLISTVENIASKNRVAYYKRPTDNHFFKQPLEKSALKDENQPPTRQHYSLKRA